jgi:hypothetical protein
MKGIIVLFSLVGVNSFLIKAPLKQIAVTRAVTSTLTEALAVNVFDTSSIIRDLACDCEQHPYLPIYVGGFVIFGYLYNFNNNGGDKLSNIEFYANLKKNMRITLLVLFLILGKNVESVI